MSFQILPFNLRIECQSYHSWAFPLGVFKAVVPSYRYWLYNTLINCRHFKQPVLDGTAKQFFDFTHEDKWAREDGFMLFQEIHLEPDTFTTSGFSLVDFNKSMLISGHYITGSYNEFYIPHKHAYQDYDFNHDYILFGFDDKKRVFKSAGYLDNGLFQTFDIPYDAYYDAVTCNIVRNFIYYHKPLHDYDSHLNTEHIYDELENYLDSRKRRGQDQADGVAYGLNVWNEFTRYVLETVDDNDKKIDLRFCRFYMEFHQIMYKRIKKLYEDKYLKNEELCKRYLSEVSTKAQTAFSLFVKHSITHDRKIIDRICALLDEVDKSERQLISQLLEELVPN